MAFNNLGKYTVAAGESFYVLYWFRGSAQTGGDDHGAQYCMMHPMEGFGSTFFVTDQGKSDTGQHANVHNGGGTLYHVKGYNAGPYAGAFSLQGGGLV